MPKIKITLNDLYGEQQALAEAIGIEAYISLVEVFGGTSIYIAKMDKIQNIKRNQEIINKFNGYNYTQLAREYGLTDRTIREILSNRQPLRGQMSLWDEDKF